jgi:hypothetical protein
MYRGVTSTIPQGMTVPIKRGVKQGDPLSPLWYHIAIDPVVRNIKPFSGRLAYGDWRLKPLAFVNEIVLVAHSAVEAQEMQSIITLESGITECGLEVSPLKCAVF